MTPNTHWLQRWMPRPFDWVAAIFYLGTLAVHFYFRNIECCRAGFFGWVGGVTLSLALVVLFVLDRLEYWRYGETPPKRVATLYLAGRVALIVLVSVIDDFNFSMFLYVFIPFLAYPVFGKIITYALVVAAWLVYLQKLLRWGGLPTEPHEIIFFIVYTAGLIFMVSMATVVSGEKSSRTRAEKLLQDLEFSHRQLQDYATRVADLAATEERNRLARDIHDSLGHYLTVINVQLEKALAFRPKKPAEADQAVLDAKRLASEALQDIRRSVSALRTPDESFSLKRTLTVLVNNVNNEQLQVELAIQGEESGFSRQSLVTLYRVAQEGLTNVQKHAQARKAAVQIKFDERGGTLELHDNGQGFDVTRLTTNGIASSSGYGLPGLQERVELVGGSLQVESTPQQGTRLWATVPKNPLALVTSNQ